MGADVLSWSYVWPGRFHVLGLEAVNLENRIPPALMYKESRPFKDLVSLLNAARSCSSTDPRDRIYALMGLLKNSDDLNLVADYNKPVEHVYAAVARQAIVKYNHLDILAEASLEPYLLRKAVGDFTHLHDLQRIFRLLPIPLDELVLSHWDVAYPGVDSWIYAVRRVNESRASQEQAKWIEKVRDEWDTLQKTIQKISIGPWAAFKVVDRLYAALGISRAEEEEVLGKDVLHSSFLTIGGTAYLSDSTDTPMRRTYHFTNFVERLPWCKRSLIRDALYFHHVAAEKIQGELLEAQHSLLSFELLGQKLCELEEWQRSNEEEQILHLPSWVPDFQIHRALRSLAYWRPKVAGGTEFPTAIPKNDGTEGIGTLQVRALRLDTITASQPQGGLPASPRLEWKDAGETVVRHDSASFFKHFSATFDQALYGRPFEDVWDFRKCRRLCPTARAFAIAPFAAAASDGVYLLRGASVPFVLRAVPGRDRRTFSLLGECYLHGCRGPAFADDYLELLGDYRRHFGAAAAVEGLPWETAYLV
ncbi:hypothetical protein BK809_0006420 [Diplodia seriata]|uniref:Uncharacterized protein n=1 Tax=Diplodia seriata TaxID=420778 RepID=A0A1S8B3H7_9PEZI|nr:hypothetical protein BK809_0006420 [Diplodia seriata]